MCSSRQKWVLLENGMAMEKLPLVSQKFQGCGKSSGLSWHQSWTWESASDSVFSDFCFYFLHIRQLGLSKKNEAWMVVGGVSVPQSLFWSLGSRTWFQLEVDFLVQVKDSRCFMAVCTVTPKMAWTNLNYTRLGIIVPWWDSHDF